MYAGKVRRSPTQKHMPFAVCSLCAQDIQPGEKLWYRNGVTVCADCFLPFAREALRPFEYQSGEEAAQ